jgi:hypothetical protein
LNRIAKKIKAKNRPFFFFAPLSPLWGGGKAQKEKLNKFCGIPEGVRPDNQR